MGSKKKNKQSRNKYPKRTHRQAFGKLSHSKRIGKKKCNKGIKDLEWLIKDLKIMEDQKIDSNNEKKVNDNINKNLEILPEKKELIKKEINSNNNDNKNSIYEKFLFKNEDIYLSKENLQ